MPFDDAVDALDAALALCRQPSARAGIGEDADAATRMMALAQPGTVVVSEAMRLAVDNGGGVRFVGLEGDAGARAYVALSVRAPSPFARRPWGPGAPFAAIGLILLVAALMLWSRYVPPPG